MHAGAHLPQLGREGDQKKNEKTNDRLDPGRGDRKCLLSFSFLLGQKEFCEEEGTINAKHARCTSRSLAWSWPESCWQCQKVWNRKLTLDGTVCCIMVKRWQVKGREKFLDT